MANDYYIVSGDSLRDVANKIREKGDTSEQLTFPQGFIDAIDAINGDEKPITTYLTYASYDGSAIYKTVTCLNGVSQESAPADPTRPATAANTYTFVGWSKSMNSTTADADAQTGVIADRTIYAAYTATARTYTVRFYNGSTLLETDTGVPYGGSTTYDGATPVSKEDSSYIFKGWNPTPTNIQGDTSCYAQFNTGVEDVEITDSWDTIIANIDNGTYKNKYSLGNYKPLDLGTEGIINMQIVAFDSDELASGGYAPVTFVAKELLATKHAMASTMDTSGGWEVSSMREYLKNTIKPLISSNVASRIQSVKKIQSTYSGGAVKNGQTTIDDVWIPSIREINSGVTTYESIGVKYDIMYKTMESRIKTWNGNPAYYNTRSVQTTKMYRCFTSTGDSDSNGASGASGVCLGFCLGLASS